MEEYILNIVRYLFTSEFSYVFYGKVCLRLSVCKVGLHNLGCVWVYCSCVTCLFNYVCI